MGAILPSVSSAWASAVAWIAPIVYAETGKLIGPTLRSLPKKSAIALLLYLQTHVTLSRREPELPSSGRPPRNPAPVCNSLRWFRAYSSSRGRGERTGAVRAGGSALRAKNRRHT